MIRRIECRDCGLKPHLSAEDAGRGWMQRKTSGEVWNDFTCDSCASVIPAGATVIAITMWPKEIGEPAQWEHFVLDSPPGCDNNPGHPGPAVPHAASPAGASDLAAGVLTPTYGEPHCSEIRNGGQQPSTLPHHGASHEAANGAATQPLGGGLDAVAEGTTGFRRATCGHQVAPLVGDPTRGWCDYCERIRGIES